MFRSLIFSTGILTSVVLACPVQAAVAFYDVVGTGKATVGSGYRIFLPNGGVQDYGTTEFFGTGSFTAQYAIDLSAAPGNNADPNYTSVYQSSGSHNFLRSMTFANIGGRDFGITTNGSNYQIAQTGKNFPNFTSSLLGATGQIHGQHLITYYDNGRVKSDTGFDYYNQFYTLDNSFRNVGGLILPNLASGSQQIIYSAFQFNYSESGSLSSLAFAQRSFLGNGVATLRIDNGATFGAPSPEPTPAPLTIPIPVPLLPSVPEPMGWTLMIGGFGLIGATMRWHPKPQVTVAPFAIEFR
jgi:hypothetical protein